MTRNDSQVSESTRKTATPASKRAAIGSYVGTSLEWYDFFIYGTAAGIIFPHLFFSPLGETGSVLVSLGSFGIAWIARPIGGVLFGHFGDRVGRKTILIITLIMMGLVTVLIGLLPTYDQIGMAAPVLLIVLRLVQGLALGGEWGGAAIMVVEHAPRGRRGLFGSFVQMGVPTGLLLATGAFSLVGMLPEEQFMSWGWRIPFISTVALILVGHYIRRNVTEPEAFAAIEESDNHEKLPIATVLATAKKRVALLAAIQFVTNAAYFVAATYSLVYVTDHLGLPESYVFNGLMIGAVAALIAQPLFAALSDKIGRRPVYIFGACFVGVWAFPFFALINTGEPVLISTALVVMLGVGYAATGGINASIYTEQFPTRIRYTGSSLAYNLSGILTSSPVPIIAALIVSVTGEASLVSLYLVITAALTIFAVLGLRETFKDDIDS
ncbi:MFS transporter [Leucobacter sp. GX24907]